MSASPKIRPREQDDALLDEPDAKRTRLNAGADEDVTMDAEPEVVVVSAAELEDDEMQDAPDANQEPESLLPPSHVLLKAPPAVYGPDGTMQRIMETDVGISEYIGHDVPKIEGIIKQRFTDFLVFEVDLDSQVIHLKSLGMPESSKKPAGEKTVDAAGDTVDASSAEQPLAGEDNPKVAGGVEETATPAVNTAPETVPPAAEVGQATEEVPKDNEPWPERFTESLKPFLSEDVIAHVKTLFLEGPEPPFVSDSGWGGRQSKPVDGKGEASEPSAPTPAPEPEPQGRGKRGRGRGRGDRGGRGGRGGARGGRAGAKEDHRKVISNPIASKETRTGLHKIVRDLFGGKLDTETDTTAPASDEGSRIVIKWSKRGGVSSRGGRGGGRGGRTEGGRGGGERGGYPPYIHFTLQKANRDTQDALAALSRTLHSSVKDLSVAGTKDKRGVTVQRVSLRRGNKTVEDVWKMANGLGGKRSMNDILTQRGERGVRVGDFNYRKASLELGMLKGNAFVITLRTVRVDSMETLDRAMNTIKTKGFINYYGMQRFGTASIPTHSIGLALLKGDWHRAVSLILRNRPGEHPDVVAARDAWLVDGDLDKALELMPRRVVAERCILESYKKQGGDTRNAMGSLSTIPRNLRLMYVHAYQSYVWNAIVSERIRMHGADKPVVGDLVFDEPSAKVDGAEDAAEIALEAAEAGVIADDKAANEDDAKDGELGRSSRRSRKAWEPPKVKVLAEEDLDKYSIFDVIMPLPGKDVDYPGGRLGERYKEFLKKDGLDPDNWVRKQKDYSLGGSYRKILHLPKELSWSVIKYTDPDVALAQSDEDKLLGMPPPVTDENGKFLALQINLQLGTAAYATMALREVTKTETSSHYQTTLTQASEDQKYRTVEAVEGTGAE